MLTILIWGNEIIYFFIDGKPKTESKDSYGKTSDDINHTVHTQVNPSYEEKKIDVSWGIKCLEFYLHFSGMSFDLTKGN